jgi:hypothetical protein
MFIYRADSTMQYSKSKRGIEVKHMRKISAIFTTIVILLSTIAAAQNLVTDQTENQAAIITDITDGQDTSRILVQYLGSVNARLHWAFFDDTCTEIFNDFDDVTPLELIEINQFPIQPAKLVIVVEDVTGDFLINQPIIATKYVNDQAVKNLPGMPAMVQQGATIGPSGTINFDGTQYGLFAQNLIDIPLLSDITNAPSFTNRLSINIFTGQPIAISTVTTNDEEDQASNSLQQIACAGITDLTGPGYNFNDIGGPGIIQGPAPEVPQVGIGAGVLQTARTSGAIFGEAYIGKITITNELMDNIFFQEPGDPVALTYTRLLPPDSIPQGQGIFTGNNINYQNPYQDSAIASLGVQKAVSDIIDTTTINEEAYNRDVIWAIYNNGAARTAKARLDFVVLDPQGTNECEHKDFSLDFTAGDVEYVRLSQVLQQHLVPGDSPVVGLLTVWDPTDGQTLLGYKWDVIMETLPECSDGIDNDLDTAVDFPADAACDSEDDDDETTGGPQSRVDGVFSVDAMAPVLTLSSTTDRAGKATFEAARNFNELAPVITSTGLADYNIFVVNWDAIDDPSAASQTLNFQITDQEENARSLRIPAQCITVLDKQSFPGLSDGTLFGTNPSSISITGSFDQPHGLAAFYYYNPTGIPATESIESGEAGQLAFTNAMHGGEIFTDIQIMPGDLPGEEGEFNVQVGITPSVSLTAETVTASWYTSVVGVDTDSRVRGPLICEEDVTITTTAGKAFAINVDGCPFDPTSVDAFLRVQSTNLGDVELFVPATT